MTAYENAKQLLVSQALGAELIARYFSRMVEANMVADGRQSVMAKLAETSSADCRVLVTSTPSADQMVTFAMRGQTNLHDSNA